MSRTKNRIIAMSRAPAALLAVALLALVACGEDEAGGTAEPREVTVTATDSGGRNARLSAPSTVPAGLITVTLRNRGEASHSAQLVRVDPGHTAGEVLRVIEGEPQPIPDWLHAAGGTAEAPPGGSTSATQQLRPGSYLALDIQAEAEAAVTEFKVEGKVPAGELPSAPATVEAFEYGFKASGLKRGSNTVRFSNTGEELHHLVALPIKGDATLADVRRALTTEGRGGDPPLDFENGANTAIIDGGSSQVTRLELKKRGRYALLCFVNDRRGGTPHVAQGMIAETTVR